jgi:hypothetical protein
LQTRIESWRVIPKTAGGFVKQQVAEEILYQREQKLKNYDEEHIRWCADRGINPSVIRFPKSLKQIDANQEALLAAEEKLADPRELKSWWLPENDAERLAKIEKNMVLEADEFVQSKYFIVDWTFDNYVKNHREFGSGPCSLGKTLTPNEDIYALVVASQFRASTIDNHRWEAEVASNAVDEMVSKF